jgi:hypothetical protein
MDCRTLLSAGRTKRVTGESSKPTGQKRPVNDSGGQPGIDEVGVGEAKAVDLALQHKHLVDAKVLLGVRGWNNQDPEFPLGRSVQPGLEKAVQDWFEVIGWAGLPGVQKPASLAGLPFACGDLVRGFGYPGFGSH